MLGFFSPRQKKIRSENRNGNIEILQRKQSEKDERAEKMQQETKKICQKRFLKKFK